jgi:hypothetical protein
MVTTKGFRFGLIILPKCVIVIGLFVTLIPASSADDELPAESDGLRLTIEEKGGARQKTINMTLKWTKTDNPWVLKYLNYAFLTYYDATGKIVGDRQRHMVYLPKKFVEKKSEEMVEEIELKGIPDGAEVVECQYAGILKSKRLMLSPKK